MARFHMAVKHSNPVKDESHLNFMNGTSYDVNNPIVKLQMIAASSFFGEPQYYVEGDGKIPVQYSALTKDVYLSSFLGDIAFELPNSKSTATLLEEVIDKALAYNVKATLELAVRLRHEDFIRVTPQVILVRAANNKNVKGSGLVRQYAKQIIHRADEPSIGLAYHLYRYKDCPIPNSLKKAWRESLERFTEYDLAKYKMENKSVKTVDVINLVHPKSEAVSKLTKNELKVTDKTWEGIISSKGSTKENWIEAIDKMGHMALLRNLRNFVEKGVPFSCYSEKLLKTVKGGMQLPFRYFAAYKALQQYSEQNKERIPSSLYDLVEECLVQSFDNMPRFNGNVISLCDNSGSAHGAFTSEFGSMTVAEIANLSGVLTGHCADNGYVGVFGDDLNIIPTMKRGSVFEQLKEVCKVGRGIGEATENGIWMFFDKAIKNKEQWDHIFIYSDMQAGHGGLYGRNVREYKDYMWHEGRNINVAKLIKTYREKVNPNVMVYMCQVAGYHDTLVPEYYDRTFIFGGWGAGIFKFANCMNKIFNSK